MERIYIAGKLNDTAVNYIKNVHQMLRWSNEIKKLGYAVYVPATDFLLGMQIGNYEYEDYFQNSGAFLEVCDGVFVCPNSENSKGTIREIEKAKELNIPIYYTFSELLKRIKNENT